MCKILIFGGTSEGRLLAEFCAELRLHTLVSVTTEYGAKLLVKSEFLHTVIGKMKENEIAEFISEHDTELVIDATHPYAKEATCNIENACKSRHISYIRIVRESTDIIPNARYFDKISDIVDYLNTTSGDILLTTGSKNLSEFCSIKNFRNRCVIRILPTEEVIKHCIRMGFDKSRIIAEKGSFTVARNMIHLRKFNSRFLVTKDSGTVGGFAEKIISANNCGVEILILNRPKENGITLESVKKILMEKYYE